MSMKLEMLSVLATGLSQLLEHAWIIVDTQEILVE